MFDCLSRSHLLLGKRWKESIALGQLLSILLTGTGIFSQLLSDRGISIPTTQSFLNYFLLSLHGLWLFSSGHRLQVRWWKYFLLALADVEGNFFLVLAYQYTTITSVQILDCFTIPAVMVLSVLVLRMTFSRWHYYGVLLCLAGLVVLVVTDVRSGRNDENEIKKNKLLGDMFVLLGCVCYAISNLGQEHLVKTFDRTEYLAMLGLCGSVISGVQMWALEREGIATFPWGDVAAVGEILGFATCLFSLYMLVPTLLVWSSAVFLNLSFLTADFWTIVSALFLFNATLYPSYFLALALTLAGLILWNLSSLSDQHWVLGSSDEEGAGSTLESEGNHQQRRVKGSKDGQKESRSLLGGEIFDPDEEEAATSSGRSSASMDSIGSLAAGPDGLLQGGAPAVGVQAYSQIP
jgi:solute carrier family 35 protein F1/2